MSTHETDAPSSVPGPYAPEEMQEFLDTFLYKPDAFLIDEVHQMDPDERLIKASLDTCRPLPFRLSQRTDSHHPAHVAAAEILQATGSLGCMHAWFFHGCRWREGWAGFGNRIHRADFKTLAHVGPPLRMQSRETRTRVGKRRIVIRFEFRFQQEERIVYVGDQSAMFVRDYDLEPNAKDKG